MNRADYALLVAPFVIGAVTWYISGGTTPLLTAAYTAMAVAVSVSGLTASRYTSTAAAH